MVEFIVWLVVALFISFIILPWRIAIHKAKFAAIYGDNGYHSDNSVEDVLFPGIPAAIFWPLTIVAVIGWFTICKPTQWIFEKSIDMFMPKPPKPPKPKKIPQVDETKSSYRKFAYLKGIDCE